MSPLAALLCLCLGGAEPPDRWLAEDKWKHFFASFVATSLAASGARAAGLEPGTSIQVGVGVGAGVGLLKEIRDGARPKGVFSVRDLAWDAAGVGAAAAVLQQTR